MSNIGEYFGQRPFKFWCQKVLPLVYDDSLSYSELLSKVVYYLNNVISDVSTAESNIGQLLNAFNALQEYVNTYFDELDVDAAISAKLDDMAEDGTLSELIEPIVENKTAELFEELSGQVVDVLNDIIPLYEDMLATETALENYRSNIAYVEESATATASHVKGSYFNYGNYVYKAIQDIAIGGTITPGTNCASIVILNELFTNYANIYGYYWLMSVGKADNAETAEQLLATTGTNKENPYNFQAVAGNVRVNSDREILKNIVGGTIAWNQLDSRRTSPAYTNEYSTMWWIGANALNIKNGHVYMFSFVQPAGCSLYRQAVSAIGLPTTYKIYSAPAVDTRRIFLCKANADGVIAANGYSSIVSKRETTETAYSIDNKQVFDLTQMFGSVIADAINALETANEGAGVAWFNSLFPNAYYVYNAGELLSVNTSEHNTVGFNQWDGLGEDGKALLNDGTTYDNASKFVTSYIRIIPNEAYYLNNTWESFVCVYDSDKSFIRQISVNAQNKITLQPGDVYIRCTGILANKASACINLSKNGERDGDYEPYVKNNYPLDTSLTLRGIPKLDASGNLYYDGDTYAPDGTVTRKYASIDLGSLEWEYGITIQEGVYRKKSNALIGLAKTVADSWDVPNLICSKYLTDSPNATYLNVDKTITIDGNGYLIVYDSAYNGDDDLAAFTAAMSGVYLVYELAESTTETADQYKELEMIDRYGTEEFVDARAVAIPVGNETIYLDNLREKLEELPAIPPAPTTDGTYKLQCVVSDGVASYSWVSV